MSKLKKFFTKPNHFFRDYFLKRAPLNYGENVELLPVEKVKKSNISSTVIKKDSKDDKTKKSIDKIEQIVEDLYPVTFPIDVVYTWVDSDDRAFNEQRLYYQSLLNPEILETKTEITDIARFQSRNELKYSIRSILKYAPWVNHIYIVTNGQIPKWLDINFDKITIIPHSEILDKEYLPTFNSHVIESALYKIPNLSEHYIYFNDDVMLTRKLEPNYFFTSNGIVKLYMTNAKLPNGEKNTRDTPTQWAAKNARNLLYKETGFWVEHMFAHTFHPQRKSIHRKIEKLWPEEIHNCRKNKFRDINDLNISTFLHHHFALITGNAIATRTKCIYFNIRSPEAIKFYTTLINRKNTDSIPHSICLNDHVSSKKNLLSNYEIHLQNFLDEFYPEVSDAELIIPTKSVLSSQLKNKKYKATRDELSLLLNIADSNESYSYILYYYGVSCYFLYKESKNIKLLDEAYKNIELFYKSNPQHKLAKNYLDNINLEKFNIS